jgi:WD40 repeat protein
VWDAETGKEVAVLRGHTNRVISAEFSPDGKKIVTASFDGSARIHETETGKLLAVLPGDPSLAGAVFSPDGRRFLIVPGWHKTTLQIPRHAWSKSEHKGRVSIHDTRSGKRLVEMGPDFASRFFSDALWSPDGQTVHLFVHNRWQTWDSASGKQILDALECPATTGVLSADGRWLLGLIKAHRPERDYAWLADTRTGKKIATLKEHTHEVTAAAFSRDNRSCATASLDGTARIWNAEDGTEQFVLRGHEGPVHAVAFSNDGRWIVTAGDDRTARIWDTATGKEWLTLIGQRAAVYSAVFSPDSQQVLTASRDGTARLWPVDPLAQKRRPRELSEAERRLFDVRLVP